MHLPWDGRHLTGSLVSAHAGMHASMGPTCAVAASRRSPLPPADRILLLLLPSTTPFLPSVQVTDFLEKETREERQGLAVEGVPDADLFFVDKVRHPPCGSLCPSLAESLGLALGAMANCAMRICFVFIGPAAR